MMKTPYRKGLTAAALAATVAVSGCQTTGDTQDQAAGAGIGALVGAGIGALVTGDARGAAAGAAIGGALGWSVVALNQYQSRQVRSSAADSRVYGLSKPVERTQVKIRRGSNSPRTVGRGQSVDLVTDYSVMLPPSVSRTSVTESWTLKKDGRSVARLPAKTSTRSAGGWAAQAEITIPSDVPPGTYVIEHRVKAGSSYDTDESTFVVRG
ncbi:MULTISPECIES: glycine zipper domain-containing protein [Marichromatium]|uniref:Outer membrane protein with glycine zipper n=1 Tax=Marichromatium gracile TaxID=1048 RepID=A0A4R4AGB9_MARGR|nr:MULTISPECIES: glycine zipper domain-containing protein [Marichromatium]MBK1708251.1 hypothetical protein [Marichromatium gracile]RNE94458.1 hypothetical protein EBL85_02210 [Marichromatium sp. AB32]TCW38288.1 outer membrane protein with glycine zipper [Marichromatium gracile]